MKTNKIFSIIFFLTFFLNCSAKIYRDDNNKEIARNSKVFDVIIFLDQDKDAGAIKKGFSLAIQQEEAIIANDFIIYQLIMDEKYASHNMFKRLFNKYLLFKNKHMKSNFGVFIPKETYQDVIDNTKSDKTLLAALGLNPNLFQLKIDKTLDIDKKIKTLEDEFHKGKKTKFPNNTKGLYDINVDDLINILTSDKTKEIEKKIILGGHGYFPKEFKKKELQPPGKEAVIAQLTYPQYIKFLAHLEKINCILLYLSSCYSGGLNQIVFNVNPMKTQDELEKHVYKKYRPNFIIISGSLTDYPSYVTDKTSFKNFFKSLYLLLNSNLKQKMKEDKEKLLTTVSDWIKEGYWLSRKPFKNILNHIAGNVIINQTSIYIPSIYEKERSFKATEIDEKIKIITYPELLRLELEQFLTKEGVGKEEVEKYRKQLKEKEQKKGNITPPAKIQKRKLQFTDVDIEKFLAKRKAERKEELKKIKLAIRTKIQKPIQIGPKVEYLLLYPSIIMTTIDRSNSKMPYIVSMIPGPAQHYINKIITKDFDDNKFYHKFSEIKIPEQIQGFAPPTMPAFGKLFFIGETKSDTLIKNNTAIYIKIGEKVKHQDYNILSPKETYINNLKKWINETIPLKKALEETTKGIETKEQFEKIVFSDLKTRETKRLIKEIICLLEKVVEIREKKLVINKPAYKSLKEKQINKIIFYLKEHKENLIKSIDKNAEKYMDPIISGMEIFQQLFGFFKELLDKKKCKAIFQKLKSEKSAIAEKFELIKKAPRELKNLLTKLISLSKKNLIELVSKFCKKDKIELEKLFTF